MPSGTASIDAISARHDPVIIEDIASIEWDEEADVVVVGSGGAGLAAALQAFEDGADVLAIDRFRGGGATSFSGGVIYSCNTEYQREAGFVDEPKEAFKYLKAEGAPLSDETLLRFCEGSNGDLQWLEGHGVPYGSEAFLAKTAFPPDGYWLYYSGNEVTPAFRDVAVPAPRGHRVKTPGNGGPMLHAKLLASAREKGVRFLTHAPVRNLILDQSGRVVGVEADVVPSEHWQEHDALFDTINPWAPFKNVKSEKAIERCRVFEAQVARPRRIRARGGVILSSGGFIYNLDFLARHRPEVARSYEGLLRLGTMGCDGSGIMMAHAAGGATDRMEQLFIGSPLSPPISFLYGIIVNREGKRFVNEDAYHAQVGNVLSRQSHDGAGWLILEGRDFARAIKEALFPGKGMFMLWGAPALLNISLGGTKFAFSLKSLARKCLIDVNGLQTTIADYNASIDREAKDALGKSPDKLHKITDGPFFAINLAISNRFMPTMAFTLGGLVVDEETGQVRKPDGSMLEGLYAAGRAAVGLCSNGYMSGLSIADAIFSGRRAGHHAAYRMKRQTASEMPAPALSHQAD